MLDATGGVRSDVTVARLDENRFQLGINGPTDIDWLHRHRGDADVTITDITADTCCVGVWGPLARDLVAPLCSIDLYDNTLGYYKAARASIDGIEVTMLRISYVGELGWEIYTDAAHGEALWDRLAAAGEPLSAVWAGRGALDILRLEKGYRSWGTDMDAEMSPEEAGLSFAVGKKHTFFGRDAMEARLVTTRLQTIVADDPGTIVMGGEPVGVGSEVVGFVTSAAFSPMMGRTIGYARLAPHLNVGDHVSVEYFGIPYGFTISDPVLVDPENARIKGLIGVNN
jgi:glycine cleavage system aminomethyltransferase T